MKTGVKFFSGIFFLLVSAPSTFGGVVINEIMYHPASTNLLEEWFELYNPGPTNVNLSGWKITQGVQFAFPTNTTLAPGGYLVVAADAATFAAKYPGVTNVVPGSAGPLGGHTIELDDNTGQNVNRVAYYDTGDWAVRLLGAGGVPGALDRYGGLGWEWFAPHDGGGASLELMNPALPNTYAQNWGPNKNTNSTPGRANSIATNNVAPFITDLAHSPVIPQPSEPVTISARVVDEATTGVAVTLNWRVDGAAGFNAVTMSDDGAHGDGLAGDGIYGAILPAQPNAAIVEFYLEARDAQNNLRTYPNWIAPTGSTRTANLLYQVDSGIYAGDQPLYRFIMTAAERAYLAALSDNSAGATTDSDADMNATWITADGVFSGGTTTQLRYNVGVRNRGHGTRRSRPHNFHINIPSDRLWKNQAGINLNSQYTHIQVLGSALFRRLAVPMADSRAVQVRVNGTNEMALSLPDLNSFGSYAANEQYNNDFVKRSWPLDPQGNSYRGIRDPAADISGVADLSWHGSNIAVGAYTNVYYKQNNFLEDDWSDLISLIGVLNVTNGTTTASYVADVQRVLNVDEWMKYMAINTLLDNNETCLANGFGDDYALYRGTNDTRFVVLPYDLDTVMGRGLTSISPRDGLFRMTALPVMDRFMKTPDFAPIYYRWLKTLAETTFSPAQMNPLLDQLLKGYVPQATIDTMKAFNASHMSYVLSQIPLALTAQSSLTVTGGYPRSTTATTALFGSANAIDTRNVLVNGAPATYVAWQGTWTANNIALVPGINRIVVQSLDSHGAEFARTNIDIWYDTGTPVNNVSGTLPGNATWSAAGGPYNISGNLTIPNGVTLTIQPGTTVYVASGATITVNGTGRILAQGTETQRIRIGKNPAATGNWGSLDFINSTVESRLAYVDFDSCGGTTIGGHNAQIHVNNAIVFIDHCAWPPTPVVQYISFDGSSFIVQSCVFPSYPPPSGPESLHGINGIPAGGYGIFRDNYFGHTWGFNDTIDFTGGQRPGAILQFINNVFDGASDDNLDLDSTDAWIEGNIFMHVHRDPNRTDDARDTGSAISGGVDFANQFSEWTIINNLFYDVDHAILNKGGSSAGAGRFIFVNNTLVHVNKENGGGLTTDIAAFDFTDDGVPLPDPSYGAGAYVAHNIIWDCPMLTANYNPANHTVVFDNNILPLPWAGPGSNNVVIDPGLNLGLITDVATADWKTVKAALTPQPGSAALARGYGAKYDRGGLNPPGILIYGEPVGTNASAGATLTVAPGGTFNWGTVVPPYLWGYTQYKWKLDNGAWSAETPITTQPTISLNGLANGPHTVYVTGKNDAGYYQDDPFVYPTNAGIAAHVTVSRTWTVNTSYSHVRLNEVLAKNVAAVPHGSSFPDLIELYNDGGQTIDLSDLSITDSASSPRKFVFPLNTLLGPGQYLVLYADNNDGTPGIHLGFSLKAGGDDVYLFDKPTNGGGLIDSVVFGIQLADYSIGRAQDGGWALCAPTFGAANVALPLSDFHQLKINEWLADAQFAANNDFIELYNPGALPAPLGGLFLSDAAGAPARNPIPALSFIAGNGFTSFVADGDSTQGADHVNFKLDPNVGIIILSDPALNPIDAINYGPQRTDVAQGRSPSGSDTLVNFLQPTAGGPNPAPNGGTVSVTNVSSVAVNLLTLANLWKYNNSGTDYGTTWSQVLFDDSAWTNSGAGLFGFETTPAEYPYPFVTTIPAPNQAGGHTTVYYRTHFQWNGGLTNINLVSTNFIDDGSVYYLNGVRVGSLRMPATVTYSTPATNQPNEGLPEVLFFPTNNLLIGDNLMAVEVHQVNNTSSDDVFGLQLSAVQFTTNIITTTTVGVPIVLNEILADNHSLTNADGTTSDWIELFNTSTNSLDLADVSLSNDPNAPRKFVFAPNTIVAAGGFLVIYCNNNLPAATNNTGFSLNATGDSVFLFNRLTNGGGLIDAVTFGLQTADFSIGRFPNGSGAWTLNVATPGALNSAAGLGTVASLTVNEWMAEPAGGDDWFEIYNSGDQPVSLGGLFFTDDLTKKTLSPVPPLSFIGTGANGFVQFQADNSPNAGADHVKFKLNKTGDTVGLYSSAGTLIAAVGFGEQQTNVSQGRFPDGSTNIISFTDTVSPAESNYLPLSNVVVNEVLSHTDPPFEDAIEFYNPGAGDATIGGWFISNTQEDLKKYRIADGTTIPAGGFKVFYEYQFNPTNGSSIPFTFNSAHGDQMYLSEADSSGNLTGYRAAAKFGAAAHDVSFGRYTNSVGQADYVAMSALSFGVNNPSTIDQFRAGTGAANSYPLVGPVVINEIMFHPPGADPLDDNTQDEYLELFNLTPNTVALFDPSAPTNTWKLKDGVDYTFPQNVTLPAGGFLLLVNFDPVADPAALAEFRARYNLGSGVPILGPYNGKLNNAGESVGLYKPDPPQAPPHPDAGFVPYVLVEHIDFLSLAPWPAGADGTGSSLQRQVAANYGNDPANWFIAAPTAAAANTTTAFDSDGDGLPDAWEIQYFGSIGDPRATPNADPDGDGFTNLQEYVAGTNPTNPTSRLQIDSVNVAGGQTAIQFEAVAGKTYTILYRYNLSSGTWLKLTDIPAQPGSGAVIVNDPTVGSATTRFYRLVTP